MSDCVATLNNLGLSRCNILPGLLRGMIETPLNFSLTPTNALVAANWQTALLQAQPNRIYLWPWFRSFEDDSEKTVYEETDLSTMDVRDGRYRFNIQVKESLCVHKAMFQHSGPNKRMFLIDTKGQIIGSLDQNGNFVGFDVELLKVEKLLFNNGKVSTKTPIRLVLSDNKELDNNGAIIQGVSFVNSLYRIVDVVLAETAASTTSDIKISVTMVCDGSPVTGLAIGDFTVVDNTGASVTINTKTETSPGNYTLHNNAAAFAVSDKVDLVAASALSIPGFESTGAILAA